jgi:hypothetical protein
MASRARTHSSRARAAALRGRHTQHCLSRQPYNIFTQKRSSSPLFPGKGAVMPQGRGCRCRSRSSPGRARSRAATPGSMSGTSSRRNQRLEPRSTQTPVTRCLPPRARPERWWRGGVKPTGACRSSTAPRGSMPTRWPPRTARVRARARLSCFVLFEYVRAWVSV